MLDSLARGVVILDDWEEAGIFYCGDVNLAIYYNFRIPREAPCRLRGARAHFMADCGLMPIHKPRHVSPDDDAG